jgi:uncharacterized protein (DUF1778 family)
VRGGAGRGQGRKPAPDKRKIRFQTRYSDEEAAQIEEAAKRAGLKTSQFVRAAALGKAQEI